jgi:3-oxoacyl-[acyl-carrier protein] reductase
MTQTPLAGQVLLITGASRGIGAAIARACAAQGAYILIHYAQAVGEAQKVLESINNQGALIQADLRDPHAVPTLWQHALALSHGRIHALVNNAATMHAIDLETSSFADWQSAWQHDFQVNVFAPATLIRLAVPHFKAHAGGRIINIGSRAGHRGETLDFLPYGASKAALHNLTKSLSRYAAQHQIYSFTIAPGFTHTQMAQAWIDQHGEAFATADIPTGHMTTPQEIGALAALLLNPEHRALNGATLDMNGGSYVR